MTITVKGKRYRLRKFHVFIGAFVLVKIALMGLFSSDYQDFMFMRFVHGFLVQLRAGQLLNPYEFFKDEPGLFPYPPLMLAIECAGGIPSLLAAGNVFLKNLFFKLPLLFFDCLGLRCLMRMFPDSRKYAAILYFASPIILYSTYMHGQLDIIPTVFLAGAVECLTAKNRSEMKYMALLAAALLCKLHILAAIPVLFLYIAKRDGLKHATLLTAVPLLAVVVCCAAFWGEGFLRNTLLNNEQMVLTKISFDFSGVRVFIPVMAVFLIYLHTFAMGKVNRDLLCSLLGVLFAVFLALVPPMPGWYAWVVPFVTMFFIDVRRDRLGNLLIFAALNAAYVLYFAFAHRTSRVDLYFLGRSLACLKTDNPLIVNGLFTAMTSLLLYSVYMMYRSGVAGNSLYKRRGRPFVIGVAGDSGSGKSAFAAMLEKILGPRELLRLEGDGDHRWERNDPMWKSFTHLNPKSNYLYRQGQDLSRLKNGETVTRVDYDHRTGKFTRARKVGPKPFILFSGLHALYLPNVRRCMDLKVYMDADETLRRFWKIRRDSISRCHDVRQILEQIEDRMPDAKKYIYPQKKYADLIVRYFDSGLTDCRAENYAEKLSLRVSLDMDIDMEPLIVRLEERGIHAVYDYDDNLMMQTVIFSGDGLGGRRLPIARIADEIIPHLEEIVPSPVGADDDLHGILSVVFLMLISKRLRESDDRD